MNRVFSTVAVAGWGGYHGASALCLVAAACGASLPASSLPLTLPEISNLSPVTIAILAAAQAALAMSFGRAALLFRSNVTVAEGRVLVALAAGLALATLSFVLGLSAGDPGAYAAGVAVALFALGFDRMVAPVEDVFDEAAFTRAAMRLGARMGQGRNTNERHVSDGDR